MKFAHSWSSGCLQGRAWKWADLLRRPDRAPASSGNSAPIEQAGTRSARSGLQSSAIADRGLKEFVDHTAMINRGNRSAGVIKKML